MVIELLKEKLCETNDNIVVTLVNQTIEIGSFVINPNSISILEDNNDKSIELLFDDGCISIKDYSNFECIEDQFIFKYDNECNIIIEFLD